MLTEILRHSKRGETRGTHQYRHREHANRSMDASNWLDGVDTRGWIEDLTEYQSPANLRLSSRKGEGYQILPIVATAHQKKSRQIVVSKGARAHAYSMSAETGCGKVMKKRS